MSTTISHSELLDHFEMPPFPVRRWTVSEYRHLSEAGILDEEDRVELLDGWIVPKMTHNPPHDWMVSKLTRILMNAAGSNWIVRTQCAINTADSEPEPDIAVVRGPEGRYLTQHPQPEDVALVIEVADTSTRRDRAKTAIYASAGIPTYWIVNLVDKQIEVFGNPQIPQRVYQTRDILKGDDLLQFQFADEVVGQASVNDLLPPNA